MLMILIMMATIWITTMTWDRVPLIRARATRAQATAKHSTDCHLGKRK